MKLPSSGKKKTLKNFFKDYYIEEMFTFLYWGGRRRKKVREGIENKNGNLKLKDMK